jgi:hypothetical protein
VRKKEAQMGEKMDNKEMRHIIPILKTKKRLLTDTLGLNGFMKGKILVS